LELPFLQSSYGLFLLAFPPQLDNPHCQVQIPFHLQRKPSVNQDVGYPTCVLELLRAAEPFNVDSTLSYFRSLFNDDTPPIIILLTTEVTSWIIQYFQRTYSFCFYYRAKI